jgi:hypothetical protein
MKLFKCRHCSQIIYFENQKCEKCGHRLGYIPQTALLSAPEPQDNAWRALAVNGHLCRFCANAEFDVCNWLVDVASDDSYCVCCRHNRIIPDVSIQANLIAWRKIEAAKHRLFYTLLKLQLPLAPMDGIAGENLIFDFLATGQQGGPKVMTGHDDGLITLALDEADDVEREKRRRNEPYRTLLGHFRHEVGHYYWDRLVRDGDKLEPIRQVFGDERVDYEQASAALRERRPGELAGRICQQLRYLASVGRFRGNLGALPSYRRYAGDGSRIRPRYPSRSGKKRRPRREGEFRSVWIGWHRSADRYLDSAEQRT